MEIYHFTQVYLKSWSHAILFLRYGTWFMSLLFFIWGYFLPSYPPIPNSPKNKNWEKKQKHPGDIITLHKCTKNHDHMLYCYWEMVCDKCNFYFSFWAIFCPFGTKNQNFKKNEKNTSRYLHFTNVYQKLWLNDVLLLIYGVQQTDEQTDRQVDRKSDIEVGPPPKNPKIAGISTQT